MIDRLAHVSIPVKDYDEALKWYRDILGFEVRHDNTFGEGHRFLTVGAKEQQDLEIVLVKNEPGIIEVNQVTAWVFATDDCRRQVESLREQGVEILSEAEELPWGVQAAFADPFGNSFVLVEEKK